MKGQLRLLVAGLTCLPPALSPSPLVGLDCNANGVEDALEVSLPSIDFPLSGGLKLRERTDSIVPADIDGDQDLDLLGLERNDLGSPKFHVIENDGNGNFTDRPPVSASRGIKDLQAGDLDGDRDVDLVLAQDFAIEILWQDGKEGFEKRTDIPLGSNPARILLRDFDGDGNLDLVSANFLVDNPAQDSVSVILNQGNGMFSRPRNFAAHKGTPLLEAADLDHDGDYDLVVGSQSQNHLLILKNDGSGGLSSAEDLEIDLLSSLSSITLGDFDGDDNLDVGVTGPSRPLIILFNDGAGQLKMGRALKLGPRAVGLVVAKDMNGDRALDLVVSEERCPDFTIYLNQGNGVFSQIVPSRSGVSLGQLIQGDWNGDGAADLAGLVSFTQLAVFLQKPSTAAKDCNRNLVPDECEQDCNGNGVPDDCDIAGGASPDCDSNKVPDDCDPDCNMNTIPDACDLRDGTSADCDLNGIPDSCEVFFRDGDGNGLSDDCEIALDPGLDCDRNGSLDSLDLKPSFALSQEEYQTLHFPRSIVAVDFNGDGDLDVATIHRHSLEMLVRDRRDGAYAIARDYSFETKIDLAVAAEVGGTGGMDLILAAPNSACNPFEESIWVLENDGNLKLSRRAHYSLEGEAQSLRPADVDGDRILDLIVSTSRTLSAPEGTVWLLRGHGGGQFSKPVEVGSRGEHAIVGDLDNDGDLDIATDHKAVLFNQGDGTFIEGEDSPITGYKIEAGDLDRDGDLDLLLVSSGFQVLLNEGKGSFFPGEKIETEQLETFLIEDLDDDGAPELAVTFDGNAVSIRKNLGNARFAPEVQYPAGSGVSGLASGDVDGDRALDLIAANSSSHSISVLRNKGDGSFSTRVRYGGTSLYSLAVEDFNGDARKDLVSIECCSYPPHLALFENDGAGSFPTSRELELENRPILLEAADLNGDGAADLILPEFEPTDGGPSYCSVLLGQRDGGFVKGSRFGYGRHARSIALVDWEGDGDTDLVLLDIGVGALSFFMNRGDASFERPIGVSTGFPRFFLVGDLDGDGDQEILVQVNGEVSVWRKSGVFTFLKGPALDLGGTPLQAVLGDFDRDGDLDLASGIGSDGVYNRGVADCPPLVSLALNSGDGTFQKPLFFPAGPDPVVLAASDMDLNGNLDLAVVTVSPLTHQSQLSIYLQKSDGRFEPRKKFTADPDASVLVAKDLDGNQYPDLAVLTGLGLTIFLNRTLPPSGSDSNHDGILDVCKQVPFRRGDADQNSKVNLTDAVLILQRLFLGGAEPACEKASDANDDGKIDIADPVRILLYLFSSNGPLPGPSDTCGIDPTQDFLSCARFAACE